MKYYYGYEDRKLIGLIKKKEDATILDVGCGQGRYLIPLTDKGFRVIGIDVNDAVVSKLRDKGYDAYNLSEYESLEIDFDYIIMSHIIEHIEPGQLIDFMDRYLDKLRPGGELIVATPCLYDEFYDDYDHIKPYTPKAISVLYSDLEQQQRKPRHRLKLKEVWYRKWPLVLRTYPGQPPIIQVLIRPINYIFSLLYKVSFHLVSRTTGWVGVFEKVG